MDPTRLSSTCTRTTKYIYSTVLGVYMYLVVLLHVVIQLLLTVHSLLTLSLAISLSHSVMYSSVFGICRVQLNTNICSPSMHTIALGLKSSCTNDSPRTCTKRSQNYHSSKHCIWTCRLQPNKTTQS